MTETPLLGEHTGLGASFTDFAGWQMPLKYDSELAEHRAVRGSAGLFDLSHMGEIAVTGPGAAAALDYALAGELSKVTVGRAKYSLLCNPDGGVLDDLVVYRLAEDDYLVVANAANAPTVAAELTDRATKFEAEVRDRSAETALIAVQGPAAQEIVTSLLSEGDATRVAGLKYYAATEAVAAGLEALVARTGYTGEDGFELYVPNADAVTLWRALLEATQDHGGAPAGLACRDTLRLEAGMALYGHELTVHTDPYQAGLGRVVRLGKDFVGRDALAARAERPPERVLVGLRGAGRRAARADYRVYAGGEPVGVVTSGALSPTLGHPVALAYVDAAHREPGTGLTVDIRGRQEPYTVVEPPFYRRNTNG